MLRPFPSDGFCGGFREGERIFHIAITVALNPLKVDFQRPITGDESCDGVNSIGGCTCAFNRIGHRRNSKDRFRLMAFRSEAAHHNGGRY